MSMSSSSKPSKKRRTFLTPLKNKKKAYLEVNNNNIDIINYKKFNDIISKSAGQSVWKPFVYFQKCVKTLNGRLKQSKLMFNCEDWKQDTKIFRRAGSVGINLSQFTKYRGKNMNISGVMERAKSMQMKKK